MKDPQETALRKKFKALERRYENTAETWRRVGRGDGPIAARLRTISKQMDETQKALDEYLARPS